MELRRQHQHGFEYVDEGQGPVLLLLHGLFGALSNWEEVVAEFSTRYHSLALDASTLPPRLRPLAVTADADRELMALRHATLPLYGVQFHPEALLTPHGLHWLANWVACCNIA